MQAKSIQPTTDGKEKPLASRWKIISVSGSNWEHDTSEDVVALMPTT